MKYTRHHCIDTKLGWLGSCILVVFFGCGNTLSVEFKGDGWKIKTPGGIKNTRELDRELIDEAPDPDILFERTLCDESYYKKIQENKRALRIGAWCLVMVSTDIRMVNADTRKIALKNLKQEMVDAGIDEDAVSTKIVPKYNRDCLYSSSRIKSHSGHFMYLTYFEIPMHYGSMVLIVYGYSKTDSNNFYKRLLECITVTAKPPALFKVKVKPKVSYQQKYSNSRDNRNQNTPLPDPTSKGGLLYYGAFAVFMLFIGGLVYVMFKKDQPKDRAKDRRGNRSRKSRDRNRSGGEERRRRSQE